jgi:hypothetical protein
VISASAPFLSSRIHAVTVTSPPLFAGFVRNELALLERLR